MSIDTGQKLRLIRQSERLTQKAFSELIGVSLGTVKNYETGCVSVGLRVLETVLRHERFRKYTLWVILDETCPEAGQIAPEQ